MSTVFLDRDGVINENLPGHVRHWDEFCFVAGACDAIARLTSAGHRIIVCTNQAGIATGELSTQNLEEIHQRMLAEINKAHGHVECVYYCPHGKQEGCFCRKPRPGLLLRARSELGCDLTNAVFVGDSMTDVQAAFAAGVFPILVLTGRGVEQLKQYASDVRRPFLVKENLLAASEAILKGIATICLEHVGSEPCACLGRETRC
jgi:D-glycero-D-manno-heptose 1,7-bisphosphate phosphatase